MRKLLKKAKNIFGELDEEQLEEFKKYVEYHKESCIIEAAMDNCGSFGDMNLYLDPDDSAITIYESRRDFIKEYFDTNHSVDIFNLPVMIDVDKTFIHLSQHYVELAHLQRRSVVAFYHIPK